METTCVFFPAVILIIYSDVSGFPAAFRVLGSIILYFVPRAMHHNYSLKSAEILQPLYSRLLSPVSIIIGSLSYMV